MITVETSLIILNKHVIILNIVFACYVLVWSGWAAINETILLGMVATVSEVFEQIKFMSWKMKMVLGLGVRNTMHQFF